MKKILFLLLLVSSLWSLVSGPLLADAGWDNGFYIKSSDDQFKLNLGGRFQFLETVQKRSGAQKTPPGVARQASDNFSDTFSVRRARVQTTGTIYEKLDWFTILNIGTAPAGTTDTTDFDTAWFAGFTYNFVPQFHLSGGMVQLPLDRMGDDSSVWFLTVEPPLTATQKDGSKALQTLARNSLSMPFDLGLRADGDVGKHFSYAAGFGNGSGFQTTNANNELSYSAMAFVHILDPIMPGNQTDFAHSEKPQLTVSFGTGLQDEDAADANVPGVTRVSSWISSAGGAFRYMGFSLNSELYYRVMKIVGTSVEDTNRDSKLKDVGYYGNAGYFFVPKKLEGVLTASQIFREGADNNANEFGGGLNWYIHEGKVKTQLDYTNVLDYDDIPGLNNATYHRIRLMFSMFL